MARINKYRLPESVYDRYDAELATATDTKTIIDRLDKSVKIPEVVADVIVDEDKMVEVFS